MGYFKQPISEEIFKKKYCLHGETTPEEVFKGVAEEISSVETTPEKKALWYNSFYKELLSGRLIPAGRILANARVSAIMPNYNNCFSKDVNVLTSKGLIKISNIKKGDLVLTHRGNWKEVVNTMKRPYKGEVDVYKSQFLTEEIIVTPEHPFYQGNEEWAISRDNKKLVFPKAKQKTMDKIDLVTFFDKNNVEYDNNYIWTTHIKKGSKVSESEKINRFIENSPELAYLLGVFVGDGSTFKNNTGCDLLSGFNICFNEKDETNLYRVKGLLENIFGIVMNINISGNNWYYLRKANYPLANFFRITCGGSSKTKKIPDFIWASNVDIQKEFLQGIIDTDGTVNKNGSIEIRLANSKLVSSLQALSTLVGLFSTIREGVSKIDGVEFAVYSYYLSGGQSEAIRNNSSKSYSDHRLNKKVISRNKFETAPSGYNFITDKVFEKTQVMYDDYVYNISVIDDESYIVNNAVVHNCFTIDVEDTIEGIFDSLKEDAIIGSVGGGVGFNISKLRPKGAKVSKGGESSGVISFLKVFDQSAKTIMTGGARRAAHIAILDVSHPDIIEFITCKQGDGNGVLTQFNISVGITDAFISAVENDEDWDLTFNGEVFNTVKATWLYNLLAENAFMHNEPGTFNLDTVQRYNNGSWAFVMDRVNPCGEITMPPYSLCCLSALNLTMFVKNPFTMQAYFDWDEFIKSVHIAVRFLDNVLDATEYPLEKIEKVSKTWRRIGLGFTGLGNTFTMLRTKYGSRSSKSFSEVLAKTLRDSSYSASIELAKEKGAFPGCEIDKLLEANFIKQIESDAIQSGIAKYGLRNIAMNTTAPTGTTSLSLGNNCSSGIEPTFSLKYDRNIRTGRGEETKKETVYDYAYLLYKELYGEDAQIPDYFSTTADIGVYEGLEIQAIFQKYIDHSISKTHNLKPGTTFEEYKDLFMMAYKKGLKGFTTFNPSGSMKGVLEYSDKKEEQDRLAPKRPKSLPCKIHHITSKGEKLMILIGLLDNEAYEVFAAHHIEGFNADTGIITKYKKGHYKLLNALEEVIIEDLGGGVEKVYGAMTRLLSMSLRHQNSSTPIQFVVDALTKEKDFSSFSRGVARVLKLYITEGEKVKSSKVCPECGNTELIFQEGCLSCICGWSKCN